MWYVERCKESNQNSYLTTLKVIINNPIPISNKSDFKNYWIPILDEAEIKYKFNEYKGGSWAFESYDILKHGGYIENNINDLIYVPSFLEVAKKYGYDGIINTDELTNESIEILIPFYKENIKIICEELIFGIPYEEMSNEEIDKGMPESIIWDRSEIESIKKIIPDNYVTNICRPGVLEVSGPSSTWLWIYKIPDEWYILVDASKTKNKGRFIKCDQFDGLISYIQSHSQFKYLAIF